MKMYRCKICGKEFTISSKENREFCSSCINRKDFGLKKLIQKVKEKLT